MSGPTYRAVKGTRDLFPPESERFAQAEAAAARIFGSYGYGEVRTPCLEATELFARSVGETTDIVHKEMYTFADRKGRSLSLRPENTAGVVRAVIEGGLAAGPMPLRLWYAGPQFRYERPQAARYREFRQIGVELFGVPGPAAEVEILTMLFAFLGALGFRSLSASLNSVGTARSREEFGEALRAYLEPRSSGFGEDDRRKLAENPLRLFDSKDAAVRAALEGSPRTLDFLDAESRRHHDEVRRLLGQARIPFRDEPSLVRGLDYYTRTAFEFYRTGAEGQQDALGGGGRYDGLIEALGGPATPGVGFAIGLDRTLLVLEQRGLAAEAPAVVFVASFEGTRAAAGALVRELRREFAVETDVESRGFGAQMKAAGRANARFVVILGEDEWTRGEVALKDSQTGAQETLRRESLAAALRERMRAVAAR